MLPLMAAAGVSSLVVELFSRNENESEAKEASAAMPRDMSLEIGLKMPGETLMGNVQVRSLVLFNTKIQWRTRFDAAYLMTSPKSSARTLLTSLNRIALSCWNQQVRDASISTHFNPSHHRSRLQIDAAEMGPTTVR